MTMQVFIQLLRNASMQTVHDIAQLRTQIKSWRQAGERVALVPTMGNLHRGHIHLVECTLEEDQRQLQAAGLDLLFAPSVAAIYPRPLEEMTQVRVPELSAILCGANRPVHFGGVATVVTKLFNLVQPDVALFGEKDWQQLVVIRRLTADLDLPIEIIGCADGARSRWTGHEFAQRLFIR
jgi:pantoate--beta-alanine ligase